MSQSSCKEPEEETGKVWVEDGGRAVGMEIRVMGKERRGEGGGLTAYSNYFGLYSDGHVSEGFKQEGRDQPYIF
jgi:hypothetical protein